MKPMQLRQSLCFRSRACFVGLACLLFGNSASAQGQDPASLCDQAAILAAENSDVPVEILLAVTRVETGRTSTGQLRPWRWTVNLDGKGYWFDDLDQAMAFADQQLGAGVENFDVGCFQINLRWHGAEFSTLADVFDPQTNAAYAAQFLSDLYASEGDWKQAVAAYHSRTPDLAAAYVQKVQDVLAQLQTSGPDLTPTPIAAPARPNRFPLLQGGAMAGGGSLVPLIDAVLPLIGLVQ